VPSPQRRLALLLLAALAGLAAAPFMAHAHAEVGTPVPAVELATAGGEKVKVIDPRARVSVLVFVRSGQDRSVDALKAMARCEQLLAGKPVRFLGLLPAEATVAEARALALATGVKMPLAFDADDALYEQLLVRLHPVIYLVDARGRVAAFEQYRQIDYCDVILARIRFLLGELDQAGLDRILAPARNTMPGDDPRDISNRDLNLGRRQLKIKQYDKAIASANKALGLAPSAGAFALLGDVAAARGNCAAALKHYASALKLDPRDRFALEGQKACAGK
jgi:tetratricopeptide (TPR) repeat protein